MSIRAREATMGRVAGIDVGKASLDVSLAGGPVRQFANTAEGRLPLLQWLGQEAVTVAVCEPTGGYERPLVADLQAAGLPVVVAHPTRVRAFARVCGTEAKTDLLDAQVLARYGAAVPTVATPPPDPARTALRDLVSRRRQLVETRVQEKNRRDKGLTRAVAQSTRRHITWLDREIARLEAQIQQAVAHSPELARRAQLYRSVRGVGEVTAAVLTAYLPELGHISSPARDGAGGAGALGARQRAAAGLSRHSGWTRDGAARVVPGSPGGRAPRGGAAAVLSGPAAARQAGQSGPGRRDAQAAAAPQRGGPPGHPLDRGTRARSLKALDGQHRYSERSEESKGVVQSAGP